MKTLTISPTCLLIVALTAIAAAQDSNDKLVTVTARNLELKVPASWKQVASTSSMHVAQFDIPAEKSGDESAELVVYYFGGATGGIHANVERWIGQFYEDGRDYSLVGGKCRSGSYTLLDISGTFKKPEGPPVAQKTVDKPGSRVINVVLVADTAAGKEYYFFKLDGPDALVASQAKSLRTAMAAESDSEKPLKLDDIDD